MLLLFQFYRLPTCTEKAGHSRSIDAIKLYHFFGKTLQEDSYDLSTVIYFNLSMALGTDSFCGRGHFRLNTIEEAECMADAGLKTSFFLRAATSRAAKILAAMTSERSLQGSGPTFCSELAVVVAEARSLSTCGRGAAASMDGGGNV